jgi:hypothetical protein
MAHALGKLEILAELLDQEARLRLNQERHATLGSHVEAGHDFVVENVGRGGPALALRQFATRFGGDRRRAEFRSQPQGDVKPIAKALLARFGSLAAVLAAPVEDLGTDPLVRNFYARVLDLATRGNAGEAGLSCCEVCTDFSDAGGCVLSSGLARQVSTDGDCDICNGCSVAVQGPRFKGWPYSKTCTEGPVYESCELRHEGH